jgi:hypothetical protein
LAPSKTFRENPVGKMLSGSTTESMAKSTVRGSSS